jgi:hypothetical protein
MRTHGPVSVSAQPGAAVTGHPRLTAESAFALPASRFLGLVACCLMIGGCGSDASTSPHTAAIASPSRVAPRSTAGPSTAAPSVATAWTLRVATLVWRLPTPISREVVFADGGELAVAGGLTASGASSDAVVLLDPGSGVTRPGGRLARAVHDAAGVVLAGQRYVLGGGSTSSVSTVQRLRPGAVAAASETLPQPRSDLVAADVGGVAYVLGGYDGASLATSVLKTTDGTRFTRIGSLPVPVRYPAIAVLGDVIWLFGGDGAAGPSDVIQRIDVGSGMAAVAGRLPSTLTAAAALVLRGRIYICGGLTSSGATDVIRRFDAATDRSVPVGRLPAALHDAGSAVIGDTGYLIGGESPATTSAVIGLHPTLDATASTGRTP